ncbi:MAG TPA: glycoside hydrolase family 27 protein [Sphingomicrobium sp.]|nr:glycoside hydrolase family 27 protein [Sphingomicrobium sp.]
MGRSFALGMVLALVLAGATARAQGDPIPQPDPQTLRPSMDPTRTPNGLAKTPPMGWNSWNKFGCSVNERIVRNVADAMVASGMKDAGYEYVVIDDCWHGKRDANGFITADPEKFPSGMKALADYIHSKGLKFGIYSDAGRMTCGRRPGSQGHEYQDALTYARWGVDYLKYDWCYTGGRNAEEAYALMADALRSTGRDIVLSICEWGNNQPWLWATKIGNLWRTTGDITDKWKGKYSYSWGILNIVDMNEPLWPYAGPGHWNDPDMLEVGNGGMTATEYRSHFSLWAIMAAPLIAGNDIAAMDETTRSILTNKEVIAVDQDPLGVQGRRVWKDGDREVWVKPLAGGGRAVLLFNRGDAPAEIGFDWSQLNYPSKLQAEVRDLWQHRGLGRRSGSFIATVEPHGVVMLKVQP